MWALELVTHLTSFPPWANDPKVAVRICKNENNLLTFSSSTAWFLEVAPELLINGTLLEFAEMLALTLVWFMPSRLIPLSTFSRQCLAVVVVILLFLVDVIRSLVPELRIMFGGSVRSLTESFLPSWPRPLSLCSESGGDGVVEISLGGDTVLFLKASREYRELCSRLIYLQLLRIWFHVKVLKISPVNCVLDFIDVIQARNGQVGVIETCGKHVGSCTSKQIFSFFHHLRIKLVRIPFQRRLRHWTVPLSDAEVVEFFGIFCRTMLNWRGDGLIGQWLELGRLVDSR